MNVYEFADYKKFLLAIISSKGRRGFLTELATAMGCSQSYLSQVLKGKPEITPDQASLASDFLRFSRAEDDYFFHLVLHSRASTPRLKEKLGRKLSQAREKQSKTGRAVKSTKDLSEELRDFYYSNWLIAAVHVLTACSGYQTTIEIANRLSQPIREVESILGWLEKNKLVSRSQNRYTHSGVNVHLPTKSLHNRLNQLTWRLKGLETATDPGSIHYTSTFTISISDVEKLKQQLLTFIELQRASITKSGSEEALCFCCDLFVV